MILKTKMKFTYYLTNWFLLSAVYLFVFAALFNLINLFLLILIYLLLCYFLFACTCKKAVFTDEKVTFYYPLKLLKKNRVVEINNNIIEKVVYRFPSGKTDTNEIWLKVANKRIKYYITFSEVKDAKFIWLFFKRLGKEMKISSGIESDYDWFKLE